MALSITQIANILFKKLQGMGSTNDSRQFFEEPYVGRAAVHSSQIWSQSGSIAVPAPSLAPDADDGIVQYKEDLLLAAVAGTTNSFYHADLVDAIPFNFGDGTYNYEVKDSTSAAIPFGSGDWVVDGDAGTLTFYGTVPSNMPPTITFYKYIGTKGGGGGTDLSNTSEGVLVGRYSSGSGAPEEITIGPGLTLDATTGVLGLEDQMADYIQLGERRITDIDNLIVLHGYCSTTGKRTTLRKTGASSGYVVPGATTFRIVGITVQCAIAGATDLRICYADNDVAVDTATAFTNPVYPGGDILLAKVARQTGAANVNLFIDPKSFSFNFDVPTGKYPAVFDVSGGAEPIVRVYGYEIT